MYIGEALIGDGDELAHVDLLIGEKEGPVGNAFANGLSQLSVGHTPLLSVIRPNLITKPATIIIPKVTVGDLDDASKIFGPAQTAVGRAVADCVEEGIIPGGGSAYIHASKAVEKAVENLEGDEKTGAQIVLKALEAPLNQIAENAGLGGAVIVNKVRESEEGIGFDAYTEKYVNMIEEGILDPAKVSRSALQNATSVASSFLTTEAAVATIKEPLPPMPAGGAGMM